MSMPQSFAARAARSESSMKTIADADVMRPRS
jgi:hypothetical protein